MKAKEDPQPVAAGKPPVRWLPWAGGGAVGGAIVMFLVLAPLLRPDAKEHRPPRDEARSAARPPAAQETLPERLRHGAPTTAIPSAIPPAAPAPGPDPGALATEEGALEVARRTLAAGDALGAVSALNAYDEAYPSGSLRKDSIALRVEALVSAGHADTARELAERFLRDYPSSPHATRVRTLVGR